MALPAQTGYIEPQEYEIYHARPGDNTNQHTTMKQYTESSKSQTQFGLGFL